jgi:phospholipid/cholesterol/gamma-HCH transport system substrate-binding protein
METRANYLLVGSFVLGVVIALFGFVIWIAKLEIDREFQRYTIYFEGSVAGLSPASQVLYNGIPVGTAEKIEIDPNNPQRVKVTVEIASNTPLKQDSVAELQMQGITGVSVIQITGGTPQSPPIRGTPGEDYPVIASRPSPFQRLFAGAPELIARSIQLIEQANKLVSDENIAAFSQTVRSVGAISGELGSRSADIGKILDNVQSTSIQMREAATSINAMAATLRKDVSTLTDSADATLSVMRGTLTGVDALVEEARTTSSTVNKILENAREPLTDFSSDGLYEFSALIADMRQLVGNLTRLTTQIESDPARFFFGNRREGFEADR